MPNPAKEDTVRKVVVVGTGPVAAAAIMFMINAKKEGANLELSVLGRKGSESLKAIKEGGLKIYAKENGSPKTIIINPKEFKNITDDHKEIGAQHHVFIATKAYSHDKALLEMLKDLRMPVVDQEEATNFIFAQNGIPCWLPGTYGLSTLGSLESEIIASLSGTIVGCVVNLACSVKTEKDGKMVNGEFVLTTPIEKINLPIDCPDGKERKNLTEFKRLLTKGGCSVSLPKSSLKLALFQKLQVNHAINGICTITGKTIGEILDDKRLSIVAFGAAQETANLYGSPLRDETSLKERLSLSSSHHPSMAEDFINGKDLEVKAIYRDSIEIGRLLKRDHPNVLCNIVSILDKMVLERDRLRKAKESDSLKDIVEEAREYVKKDLEGLIELSEGRYRPPSPTPQRRLSDSAKEVRVESPVTSSTSSSEEDGEKDIQIIQLKSLSKDEYKLKFELSSNAKAYGYVRPCNELVSVSEQVIKSLAQYIPEGIKPNIRFHSIRMTIVEEKSFKDFKEWCSSNNIEIEETPSKLPVPTSGLKVVHNEKQAAKI